MTRPATQDWVNELTIMQQSVLMSAIRGPDGIAKFHKCKALLKWYRRCVLLSAFDGTTISHPADPGGGSFTGPSYNFPMYNPNEPQDWYRPMEAIADAYITSQDELPHHFQMHFMHAAEIIGYKHPDPKIRTWWFTLYVRIVNTLHLWPESLEQMDRRLCDNEEKWLERADKAATCSD